MKIYFAGSIRGGRDDKELYLEIIELLKKYGEVLTEHIGSQNLSITGEAQLTDEQIYSRDLEWLTGADIIVAEVTTPSLGVGYEIGRAENKPVLCLYRRQNDKQLSAMISGNKNITVKQYETTQDVNAELEGFFQNLKA